MSNDTRKPIIYRTEVFGLYKDWAASNPNSARYYVAQYWSERGHGIIRPEDVRIIGTTTNEGR